jgi:hypothetical protein
MVRWGNEAPPAFVPRRAGNKCSAMASLPAVCCQRHETDPRGLAASSAAAMATASVYSVRGHDWIARVPRIARRTASSSGYADST